MYLVYHWRVQMDAFKVYPSMLAPCKGTSQFYMASDTCVVIPFHMFRFYKRLKLLRSSGLQCHPNSILTKSKSVSCFCLSNCYSVVLTWFPLLLLVYLRVVGGEVGATSSLAPKLGPLGMVSFHTLRLLCVLWMSLSVWHRTSRWVCLHWALFVWQGAEWDWNFSYQWGMVQATVSKSEMAAVDSTGCA